MPTYLYECPNCLAQVELVQKISEKQNPVCQNCPQTTMKSVLSASTFVLKGKGWAKDGYS